ncbi:hypothetical protein D3C72_2240160 [compost metagenome]
MASCVMRTTIDIDALPYMRGAGTPARVSMSRTKRYGALLDGYVMMGSLPMRSKVSGSGPRSSVGLATQASG